MPDQISDKAPISAAYGTLLDELSDIAVRNALKFVNSNTGRLSVFQVDETVADRFDVAGDGTITPVLDTNEKGTKPLNLVFRIEGIPPAPKLEPKKE